MNEDALQDIVASIQPDSQPVEPVECTIDDLMKLGLKVGTVLEVEPVEGSEKLLKLTVDLGNEQRQIIAGLARSYSAADLHNKQVVIVTNLKSRMIMGLESQGMVLAASGEEGPVVLGPVAEVMTGAGIQ